MSSPSDTTARGVSGSTRKRSAVSGRPVLTAAGKSGLIMFGIVIFAAYNTGTNLVYLLSATVAAFYIVSLFMTRWAVGNLSVRISAPATVVEGEEAVVRIILRNDGKRTARFLRARINFRSLLGTTTGNDSELSGIAALLPAEERSITVRVPFPVRGEYHVHEAVIESTFPCDLLTWPRYLPPTMVTVTALPSVLNTRFFGVSSHLQETRNEDTRNYIRGEGSVFYGLREYVPGDPLKLVHWKSTAKTGKLMVQELQKNLTARYYIFLDVDETKRKGSGAQSNLEASIRLCATLCRQLSRENALSQVVIYQDDLRLSPPIFTSSDFSLLLRFLGAITYTRASCLDRLIERARAAIIPDSFLVFILVDFEEDTIRQILSVAKHNQRCIAFFNLADDKDAVDGAAVDLLNKGGVLPFFFRQGELSPTKQRQRSGRINLEAANA